MKTSLVFLLTVMGMLAIPSSSFALPIPANVEFRLNHGAPGGASDVLLGYQVISNKVQLLKCKYDFAVLGGSSSAALVLKGPDGSKCTLPSKAIVVDGLVDVVTAPTHSNTPLQPVTLAFSTGQAAGDLVATVNASAYTAGLKDVIPVSTAATSIKTTAIRNPTIQIGASSLTGGKINLFIEYLLSE